MTKETETKLDIREAYNVVTMEGLLLEIKSFAGKTEDGREYLSATLTIETAPNEQHQVEMFTMKLKANKELNGIFSSLETVVQEYKSVADVGREEADNVRIEAPTGKFSNGKLERNDYAGGDGVLRSFPQISATFVNRIDKGEEVKPFAKFSVEILVDKVLPEENEDGETGRIKLSGFVPLYGAKIIPFDFVVNKDGSSYVEDNYEKGNTVLVYGNIINTKQVKDSVVATAAFGEDKIEKTTTYVREFEVTGGSEAFDEDDAKAFDPASIKLALAQREVYLEGLAEKAKNKSKSSKPRSGFDTSSTKKESTSKGTTEDISDDDLPF